VECARRSSKASGREDLVAWGRARYPKEPVSPPPRQNRACDFHRTRLPRDWRLPRPALPLGLSGSSRSLPPLPSYGTMDCSPIQGRLGSYWTGTTSIPWRPSPWTRLSRALSSMTPPTLMRFIGGRHPSPHEPPTFTMVHSTVTFRRWLISDQSRSSRYPDRSAGTSGLPLTSLLVVPTSQFRSSFGICNTIGCGRCPFRQGLEAGVPFPVGLSHSKVGARRTAALCLLTPPSEPCMRLSPHTALQGLAFPLTRSSVFFHRSGSFHERHSDFTK